jgi:hypothetical protein
MKQCALNQAAGVLIAIGVVFVHGCAAANDEEAGSTAQAVNNGFETVDDALGNAADLSEVPASCELPQPGCNSGDLAVMSSADGAAGTKEKSSCSGYVIDEVADDGTSVKTLYCEGSCDSGDPCEKRSRTNHHGEVTEWCGCSDQRRSDCNINLRRAAEGEDPTVACPGACEAELMCQQTTVERSNAAGELVEAITCECR